MLKTKCEEDEIPVVIELMDDDFNITKKKSVGPIYVGIMNLTKNLKQDVNYKGLIGIIPKGVRHNLVFNEWVADIKTWIADPIEIGESKFRVMLGLFIGDIVGMNENAEMKNCTSLYGCRCCYTHQEDYQKYGEWLDRVDLDYELVPCLDKKGHFGFKLGKMWKRFSKGKRSTKTWT
eukprot:TRINITY_DN810_c0_g1_i1.p1 TRINITY_DN810_c0_g1~~TRINITY_DN810_c0_g1_i1.p1  ORF type:complete len:177 (-),score=31.48 TRINITY_DN810_c0_g1_i1:1078-1608(-)